jgi:protein-disulfide isomerase
VADEEERDEEQREEDSNGSGEPEETGQDDEQQDGSDDSQDDSDDSEDDSDDSDEDDGDDDEPEDKTDYLDADEKQRIEAAKKDAAADERRQAQADREAKEREESRQDKRGTRLKLLYIALGIAAVIVLAGVLISTCSGEAEKKAGGDDAPIIGAAAVQQRFAGIPQEGFALGDADAPVRLVEFADLQCPFCKEAMETSITQIIDRYVKPGRVRLEFRNFAILGIDSEKAARAAQYAASQGKAWQFIDLFYINQGEEGSGYVTDEFIRKIAAGVDGLDPDATVEAANGTEDESIARARTEAQKFGIDQTPSYLIGGRTGELRQLQVQDARVVDLFNQAIERQLQQSGQ